MYSTRCRIVKGNKPMYILILLCSLGVRRNIEPYFEEIGPVLRDAAARTLVVNQKNVRFIVLPYFASDNALDAIQVICIGEQRGAYDRLQTILEGVWRQLASVIPEREVGDVFTSMKFEVTLIPSAKMLD